MNIKRQIAAALALTIAFCGGYTSLPFYTDTTIVSYAANIIDSGSLSKTIKWTLDSEGTLTFTGSGDMPDYDYLDGFGNNQSPFTVNTITFENDSYEGKVKNVIISDGITSVGSGTFRLSSLKKVKLPDSVKSIGSGAFSGCDGLVDINVPDSVSSIGTSAFLGTKWLDEQTNKDPLFIINGILVDGKKCKGNLVIPNTVKSISGRAFGDLMFGECAEITSVTIPNSVRDIGEMAFASCSKLTDVKIGDSVTSIGDYAFSYCYALEKVTIPKSVTSIGKKAFEDTKWLSSKASDEELVIVNGILIYGNPEGDFVVPDGVTYITDSGIGDGAGINQKLTSITIPASVKGMNKWMYMDMDSLTAINVDKNNAVYSSVDGVLFNKDKTMLIAYPQAKEVNEYIIPDSVETICSYAFYQAEAKKVVIPDSVRNVEPFAFDLCQMEEVSLPKTWTEMPDMSFSNSWLKSVDIPEGVTRIGKSAFRGSLESIKLPSTLTEIADEAFCLSDLKTVTIPESVTEISKELFRQSDITSIYLPDTVTSIGQRSFYMCRDLESINIPASVRTIGEMAFYACESLQSVSLPPSVSRIDNGSFGICSCLDSITILNPNCVISDSPSTIFSYAETEKNELGEELHDEKGNSKYIYYFNGTIRGYNHSTAEAYANKYGYKFESLGDPPYILGDVTFDGVVNAVDATFVLSEYTKISTGETSRITYAERKAADVNSDNRVNASDASLMLAYYAYVSTGGTHTLEELMTKKEK